MDRDQEKALFHHAEQNLNLTADEASQIRQLATVRTASRECSREIRAQAQAEAQRVLDNAEVMCLASDRAAAVAQAKIRAIENAALARALLTVEVPHA